MKRTGTSTLGLRDRLSAILSCKDSPRKIALSFAVGVFLGMSPLLGLHTVLGIVIAAIFRLNKFVTIVGVYITNPWTIVPIYTFATWCGAKLLGVNDVMPDINWNDITIDFLLRGMHSLLWPFVWGTTLLGLVSALIGYVVIYQAVMRSRHA